MRKTTNGGGMDIINEIDEVTMILNSAMPRIPARPLNTRAIVEIGC